MLRAAIFFLLLLLAASVLVVSGGGAWPHDFYSEAVSPVTGDRCCGDDDCRQIPFQSVRVVAGGYMVAVPGQEVEYVPFSETLPAPDGNYHRCAVETGVNAGKRICFFGPDQGF